MNEIQRTIISHWLLTEHGYDPTHISDERLEQIADALMEYWGESGGFRQALDFVMNE